MSAFPPTDSDLGALRIEETYLYYDGPRLFTAVSPVGQRYFGLFVDELDTTESYLYIPVSEARWTSVRSGRLPLRWAIENAESGVYVLRSDSADQSSSVQRYDLGIQVPDEWLPTADINLAPPAAAPGGFTAESLAEESAARNRSLLAIRLARKASAVGEFPLGPIAEILSSLQDAVHALAQEALGRATERGSIPEPIVRASELSLVELRAGSLVAIVAPSDGGTLLEEPLARQATESLLDLLTAGATPDELRLRLEPLHARAVSKYRDLLEALVDTSTDAEIHLASPRAPIRTVPVPRRSAESALSVARDAGSEQMQVQIDRAILVGVQLRTRRFEVLDERTDERYSGSIEREALHLIEGLPTGLDFRYRVVILRELAYSMFTATPSHKDRLTFIGAPGESSDSES